MAKFCGQLLSDYLTDRLSEINDTQAFGKPLLLTVPISWQTKIVRHYNQNDLIARSALSCGLENMVEYQQHYIKKTKHTLHQSRIKNKQKRLQSPKGCFVVSKPTMIQDRNVVLLDDVYTTGATLEEVTKILKQAGAKKVFRITIAH